MPDYYKDPYVVPVYDMPHSLVESAAYAFLPAWHAIAMSTQNNLQYKLNGNTIALSTLSTVLSIPIYIACTHQHACPEDPSDAS